MGRGDLGGPRSTKNVDCLAAISKMEVVELLAEKSGWTPIPGMRDDYAAFFWDDHLKKPVLVEIFVGKWDLHLPWIHHRLLLMTLKTRLHSISCHHRDSKGGDDECQHSNSAGSRVQRLSSR